MWLAASIVVASWVAYHVFKALWMRWKYDLHKLPSPPASPFFGHSHYFMEGSQSKTIDARLLEWRKELGEPKIMKVCLKGKVFLAIADAAYAKSVHYAKTGGFPKSGTVTTDWSHLLTGDPTRLVFFTTPGYTPYVKIVRRTFARCMSNHALKLAVPRLRAVMDQMVDYVDERREGGPLDVEDLFKRTALDAAGQVAMEVNLGGLDGSKTYYDTLKLCGQHMRTLFFKPFMKLQYKYFPYTDECKKIKKDFTELIKIWDAVAKEILKRPTPEHADLTVWSAFREIRDPETDKPLPIEQLRGELGTVVIGGLDTTGHTMGWTVALLASYPAVTDKLVDELKTHGLCGPNAREVEFEDFAKLEYLSAVIKESLRRAHVFFFTGRREIDRDVEILGYRIPKGTELFSGGNTMANLESEWGDPMEFRPERWLSGEDLSQKYYFPFAGGERDCIGQRLAMAFLRVMTIKFVSTYSFSLAGGTTFEELWESRVASLVTCSRDGIYLNVKKRF